ncbi:hypothetical protein GCM10009819_29090 [Agromyces tropicus]|uniref:C2H2-type domain-containing protein n=1 Tax=Agromyces tropicus TaxID=555371 RepID=A0ABN2UW05_9MICO
MTGHEDAHHVSHDRYEQLKAEYCRRCGVHFDAASAHLHEGHHDDHA